MAPLRGPRARSTRWQIAMAHGHYEPPHTLATPLRPSWLFSDDAIAATEADYLALGHWDRPERVGDGTVPAYYSGSPDLARTVNLIRLTATGRSSSGANRCAGTPNRRTRSCLCSANAAVPSPS